MPRLSSRPLFPSMRPLFFFLGLAVLLASCSDYQRTMKSTNIEQKFAFCDSLFHMAEKGNLPNAARKDHRRAEGACAKALPLLEELVQLTRGSNLSERVYYYHAKCQFWMQDYTLASYYLSNFTKTFPTSEFAEECDFLSAFCYFKNSPNFELDQTDTKAAIQDLQLFLVHYPRTSLRDSANTLIDRLRGKLELKDLNNSRQYYRLRNYQGTITAFNDFLRTWPNSEFREEALYTVMKASYELAMNSVESKRKQRLADAMRAVRTFADAFPESTDRREADRLNQLLTDALARYDQPPATP